MSVNDTQIGGGHYIKNKYQHWDYVIDTNLHYLLSCATKYIARWRDKNGIEDLQKPIHYLEKAEESGVFTRGKQDTNLMFRTEEFCNQLNDDDAMVIRLIVTNKYTEAKHQIKSLIEHAEEDQFQAEICFAKGRDGV